MCEKEFNHCERIFYRLNHNGLYLNRHESSGTMGWVIGLERRQNYIKHKNDVVEMCAQVESQLFNNSNDVRKFFVMIDGK